MLASTNLAVGGYGMSQNDLIALKASFENWSGERGVGLKGVSAFGFYCAEQFLKLEGLSDDELYSGITDGGNDGGADAFYFFVNGALVRPEDNLLSPKGIETARLVIMQIKDSECGFSPLELQKLQSFADDLLDLGKSVASLAPKYKGNAAARLRGLMEMFKAQYTEIAGAFPDFEIEFLYITRGDDLQPDGWADQGRDKLLTVCQKHFSNAKCSLKYVNAQGLLKQIQTRPQRQRPLTWAESPMQTQDGWVGLVLLSSFYDFLKEPNGEFANRIFESNVRGFQRNTPVNKQIRETLRRDTRVNFWLLNNGVTIIATPASGSAGQMRLPLEDPQIVNGLQSSREIYKYFHSGEASANDKRSILVRVILTSDQAISSRIIKATNSQNKMALASLRGVDPIHLQIDEYFKSQGLYYDRRKGFYRDQGKPIAQIVSMYEVLQAIAAIMLLRPDDARARPGDYINKTQDYKSVFGPNRHTLPVYLACIRIMRRVTAFVDGTDLELGHQRNLRFYVGMHATCSLLGTSRRPTARKVSSLDLPKFTDAVLQQSLAVVWEIYEALGQSDAVSKGTDLLTKLQEKLSSAFPIKKKAKAV
jgi:hypothetical protein